MPAHNAARSIARSIQTALSQTYKNIELIIVNDGSTDNTSLIINSFLPNPRIKLINLPKNRGTLFARALLISLSSDYSIFLDSDDLLSPDIVQKSMRRMIQTGVDIVYFNTYFSYPQNATRIPFYTASVFDRVQNAYNGEKLHRLIVQNRQMYGALWGRLYKSQVLKDAVRKINIICANKVIRYEDELIHMAIRMSDARVTGLDTYGYVYVDNQQSVMHKDEAIVQEARQKTAWWRYYSRELYEMHAAYHEYIGENQGEIIMLPPQISFNIVINDESSEDIYQTVNSVLNNTYRCKQIILLMNTTRNLLLFNDNIFVDHAIIKNFDLDEVLEKFAAESESLISIFLKPKNILKSEFVNEQIQQIFDENEGESEEESEKREKNDDKKQQDEYQEGEPKFEVLDANVCENEILEVGQLPYCQVVHKLVYIM